MGRATTLDVIWSLKTAAVQRPLTQAEEWQLRKMQRLEARWIKSKMRAASVAEARS